MTWYVRADPTAPSLKVKRVRQDSIARILKPDGLIEKRWLIDIYLGPASIISGSFVVFWVVCL
jgi:hypothetical protein